MSHKKIISILLGLSVIGLIAGVILTEPVLLGICDAEARFQCIGPLHNIGQPIALGSIALGIVFVVLLFLSKPYFTAWRKFAIWFVPLAALCVFTSPTSGGSGLGLGLSLDRELAIMWSSGIYIIVSLLIIIIKGIRLRQKDLNRSV